MVNLESSNDNVIYWYKGTFWTQPSGAFVPHKPEAAGLKFPSDKGAEYSIEKIGMLDQYDVNVLLVHHVGHDG